MEQVIFNALQTSLNGGIGRYSYELAKEMYKLGKIDLKIVIREEDKTIFGFAEKTDLIVAEGIKDSKSRNYYEQFKLPKLIYKLYPKAIVHYPDSMAPLLAKNKVIITVHDLAFKSLKNAFTWKTVLWKNFMTNLSIKKACKIISITNFAKDEILKHYNIASDKINVVYNGFNDFSKEPIIYENISNNILRLSYKPYILTVSTISPRKNVDGLIKAFDLIKDKIDYNLVIAGRNGWMYQDVFELVKKLNLGDRIIFTGGINDDELKFLYKNAGIFAYVSFYEGFGLPPLEAISYGVQCIVSNKASLPEVCGQDVTYVDPYDYDDISKKLLLVSKQEGLKQYKQINKFSWMKCAEDVIAFYNTL